MRISQLLSSLILASIILAVLGCVTAPPPTAERKPTATPELTATLDASPTPLPAPAESPVPAATSVPAGGLTQAPVPTATPVPGLQPSQAIASLEWVEDGISSSEAALVEQLEVASQSSNSYFRALMEAPWVRNKQDASNLTKTVHALNRLAAVNENAALRVMELELAETVDLTDVAAVEFIHSLVALDPEGLRRLLANTTVEETARYAVYGFLPVLYLDMHDPEAADIVRSLPWVRDGLSGPDLLLVPELARLDYISPQAFRAVLREERDWLPPGRGAANYPDTLSLISTLTAVDEEAALRIIDMPTLDPLNERDYLAIVHLAALAESNPQRFQQVMAHPAVAYQDGSLFSITILILDLRVRDAEASEVLEGLPWLRKGIGEYMAGAAGFDTEPLQQDAIDAFRLLNLMEHAPPSGRDQFLTIASKNWMQNGIMAHEREIITNLMSENSAMRESAQRSVRGQSLDEIDELPWVQPGNVLYGTSRVRYLVQLGRIEDNRAFKAVLERPWLQDGLSEDEEELLRYIANTFSGTGRTFSLWDFDGVGDVDLAMYLLSLHLERHDQEALDALEALSWIRDGVTDPSPMYYSEFSAVAWLMWVWDDWGKPDSESGDQGQMDANPFLYLLKKPWVQDEVSWHENGMVLSLGHLPKDTALRLLQMPFLDSVEPDEKELVNQLHELNHNHPGSLETLLNQPEYAGGLTDDNLAEAVEVLRSLVT